MTDVIDLPGTITFTLGKKDIVRKLWSTYSGKATVKDHIYYFALLAALSRQENQVACFSSKLERAFTPCKNARKLANGHRNVLDPTYCGAWYYAGKNLMTASKQRAAGRTATQLEFGFLALAYNSVPAEVISRAAELACHPLDKFF